jgi:hypothetical protein
MRKAIALAFLLLAASPVAARAAVSTDNFLARTAGDIVSLCSAASDDPNATAAANFCEGFAVGAFDYYRDSLRGPGTKALICFPSPEPSRVDVIQKFVAWMQAHSEYAGERPVPVLFKFLTTTWPCGS